MAAAEAPSDGTVEEEEEEDAPRILHFNILLFNLGFLLLTSSNMNGNDLLQGQSREGGMRENLEVEGLNCKTI